MMNQSEIAAAVSDIDAAQALGDYFPRAWFDRLTLDDAYRILLALVDRRPGAGARRIGWKVGLTAPAFGSSSGRGQARSRHGVLTGRCRRVIIGLPEGADPSRTTAPRKGVPASRRNPYRGWRRWRSKTL